MSMLMRIILFSIWAQLSLSKYNPKPLESIAKLVRSLSSTSAGELEGFSESKIKSSLGVLSNSQSILKTMDGVTHQLRNSVKDSTSLHSRFKKFISSKKKSRKEAAKVYEYTNSIERGLQAAEVLQAVSLQSDNQRCTELNSCGLIEVKRFPISHNKIDCIVSVLCSTNDPILTNATTPPVLSVDQIATPKYATGEMIVAVTEEIKNDEKSTGGGLFKSIQHLLKVIMKEEPISLELQDVGLSSDEITLQPALLKMSMDALNKIEDMILPERIAKVKSTIASNKLKTKAKSTSKLHMKTNSKMDSVFVGKRKAVSALSKDAQTAKKPTKKLPHRLRFIGYSSGGAIASYLSMILEGNLAVSSKNNSTIGKELKAFVGQYAGRVRCIAIAPPPCVSRFTIPQYITSIICGDDVVVRSTKESLQRFLDRVLQALKSGAGSGIPLKYMLGTGLLGDFTSTAKQSLSRYTGNKHDISGLSIPGRVMFVKSRQMKSGATIQRVLRGNWQEDVLWQLHDILLSTKMLDHHSLEYYIQTLNRC